MATSNLPKMQTETILQYNVDMAVREENFTNTKWINRKGQVINKINTLKPSIACLQEMRHLDGNDTINQFLAAFTNYKYIIQHPSLPYLPTFEEISQKLQKGEIEKWFLEPDIQHGTVKPNVRMSFIGKDGKYYNVVLNYDQQNNKIGPPLELPPTGDPIKSSLIKWENTHNILNSGYGSNSITPKISNVYGDHEIDGKVSSNYFDKTFQNIDNFKPEKYHYHFRIVPTDMDDQSALLRQWIYKDTRLQFWITSNNPHSDEDPNPYVTVSWVIIYGSSDDFLIVGNNGSHPFVITPTFEFGNSDGSTTEDIDFPILNLDQVKYLLKTKAVSYIFDQIH